MRVQDAFATELPPDSIGQRCHDAIIAAGEAKAEAFRLERQRKRTFSAILHDTEGKSVADREIKARAHAVYLDIDQRWSTAEYAAITAKAKADALEIAWETWRTAEATKRHEMGMR